MLGSIDSSVFHVIILNFCTKVKANVLSRVGCATRMGDSVAKNESGLSPSLGASRSPPRPQRSARRSLSRQTTIGERCGGGGSVPCPTAARGRPHVFRGSILSPQRPSQDRFAEEIANRRREKRVENRQTLPAMTGPGAAFIYPLLSILVYLDGKAKIKFLFCPYRGSIRLKSG